MISIGIDPGKNIGLAIIHHRFDKNPLVFYIDQRQFITIMKQISGYDDFQRRYKITIEKVHTMPNDGRKSAFMFGQSVGFINGVLYTLGFNNINEVSPQVWRKFTNTHSKQDSIDFVNMNYKNVVLRPTPRCRVDNHNMADALCLAHFGAEDLL